MPSVIAEPVVPATNGHPLKAQKEEIVTPELSHALALGGIRADANSTFQRADKPNVALWVKKDNSIYQREIPYPSCAPDAW
jgi:hypothetical protein